MAKTSVRFRNIAELRSISTKWCGESDRAREGGLAIGTLDLWALEVQVGGSRDKLLIRRAAVAVFEAPGAQSAGPRGDNSSSTWSCMRNRNE